MTIPSYAQVEDSVEDSIEDSVQSSVEDSVEDSVQSSVEDSVQSSVEDSVEDSVQSSVEDSVEDSVQSSVEDSVEDSVDDKTSERVDDDMQNDDALAVNSEHQNEDDHELTGDRVKDEPEDEFDRAERHWQAAERSSRDRDVEIVGDSIELRGIERDEAGFDAARDEWLVSAPDDAIRRLAENGFHLRAVERLGLLGETIARVEAPRDVDAVESERLIRAIAPTAAIDHNHLYSPQASETSKGDVGVRPRNAFPLPRQADTLRKSVGLIDTRVSTKSPVLRKARIVRKDFVGSSNHRPVGHGTAIASILVGQGESYVGLLPKSRLFAASVFEDLPGRPGTATTVSLVRALDWMVAQGIGIVNMSLTGPHNVILQQAIAKARARGLLVIAAIGNAGPNAGPLYPAGYEGVISVTATTQDHRVFRLANRGAYLDFAAPGVGIAHALPGDGFAASSGTSMATPFVAAIMLLSSDAKGHVDDAVENRLKRHALDLGPPGFDEIYGYGLIRPLP